MERCSIHNEGGHGFNAGSFRFFQARFVVAEMDDLDVIFQRIQCTGYILFGGNTY